MNTHSLIRKHLLQRSLLSYALYPFGCLYATIQKLRRRYFYPKPYRTSCKVISIGNIVSGGSGKTPLTIALARMLSSRGIRIVVSHRGYKGKFEHSPQLISDARSVLYSAELAGDEAHLIASSLPGIPVVVGRKRKEAIKLALKAYPNTQLIIMDDGFQHIAVARDLDIVSFSAETGIGNGFVLPSGYLREGIDALNSNCLAVIYRMQEDAKERHWEKAIAARVAAVIHSYASPENCIDHLGNCFPIDTLQNKRLVLVSGIAHPGSFAKTVKKLGLRYAKHYIYPDHYAFDTPDVAERLLHEQPELILCTQKDIMKLAAHPTLAPRLRALVLGYHFTDAPAFINLVLDSIQLG